jgi:hypothetical protein
LGEVCCEALVVFLPVIGAGTSLVWSSEMSDKLAGRSFVTPMKGSVRCWGQAIETAGGGMH